ncbi:MAG: hypothetical protein ACOCUI_02470, partial [bacterium]
MAKKKKQDETTYKSKVFGNPVINTLIILAVAAFIIVLFLPDLGRVLQGSQNLPTYIRVNGKELFVSSRGNQGYYLSTDARRIIGTLNYYKEQFGAQANMQFNPLMSIFTSLIKQITNEELYSQESKRVGLITKSKKFTEYAYNDYMETQRRIENSEDPNERPPANFAGYKENLEKQYKINNISRPMEEGILLSKLEIEHRHKINDTKSKVKYAFYNFDNYIENNISEIDIEEDKIKAYLEENPKPI